MAVYKVKAPDGSVLSLNGPENATQEQIARAAKAAFAQKQSAAPAAAPMSVEAMQEQAMAATDMPAAPAAAPAPQREFIGQSIPEFITAPIELAATGVTGATTGMLGLVAGTTAGLIESIRNGTYGTRVGGDLMAQRAMQGRERYTYAPRTQMAQEHLCAAHTDGSGSAAGSRRAGRSRKARARSRDRRSLCSCCESSCKARNPARRCCNDRGS